MTNDHIARFRTAYWQAVNQLDALRLRHWERSQVTLPQLRVLFQVRHAPGITTRDLARALGVTVSTTSGLVIKLVDRGLLARTTAPDDRRQAPLSLTDAGAALVGELSDAGRPFFERVAEVLGPDLPAATALLQRLAAAGETARSVVEEAHDPAAAARPAAEARP